MYEGGGGYAKVYAMRTRGRGLAHLSRYTNRSLLHVFCNVFISKVLLSYFTVFEDDFHYCFIKQLL